MADRTAFWTNAVRAKNSHTISEAQYRLLVGASRVESGTRSFAFLSVVLDLAIGGYLTEADLQGMLRADEPVSDRANLFIICVEKQLNGDLSDEVVLLLVAAAREREIPDLTDFVNLISEGYITSEDLRGILRPHEPSTDTSSKVAGDSASQGDAPKSDAQSVGPQDPVGILQASGESYLGALTDAF